jgi:hypothetical protein
LFGINNFIEVTYLWHSLKWRSMNDAHEVIEEERYLIFWKSVSMKIFNAAQKPIWYRRMLKAISFLSRIWVNDAPRGFCCLLRITLLERWCDSKLCI